MNPSMWPWRPFCCVCGRPAERVVGWVELDGSLLVTVACHGAEEHGRLRWDRGARIRRIELARVFRGQALEGARVARLLLPGVV